MSFLRRKNRFFDQVVLIFSRKISSQTKISGNLDRRNILKSVTGITMSDQNMAASTSSSPATHSKNRLQHEKSPYLLQHQTNPVDWYPWGEEAFALAKETDKPIFLSVGYSTCHWCHVMERESFESPSIAALMNAAFVNIKMDREERPDIDRIYMTFVQAISGSGGWPMSVWLTPDLEPFYGGTYYPPDDRYFGRPGFRSLIQTISEQYRENREKTYQSAKKIMEVLKRSTLLAPVQELPSAEETATRCLQQLTRSYEPLYGGFSDHPKFPQPVNLLFLLDRAARKNSTAPDRFSTIKMVEATLEGMAKGGIHDHVGQGFARYSVDKKWHVPHFEKMLYDQAQLVVAYTAAFNLTKKPEYAEVVKDILKYVERDLTHPETGGFFSGEDADSHPTFDSKEKKEGAFYVWRSDEVETCLGGKASTKEGLSCADVFKMAYGIEDKGNCDPLSDPHDELKEQNVLFQAKTAEETAKKFGLSKEEVDGLLDEGRTVLFNFRNINRPRPGLDTKIVTSWNGLMITGFVRAGIGLGIPTYIAAAVKAMDFLQLSVLQENGDLLRTCYRDPEDPARIVNLTIPILGCVDDFANLIAASIELFQATFDPKYLEQAIKLQEKQNELFWDSGNGGFFNSRANLSSVILRMKDDDDGAEPSSNSTSAVNLLRLYSFTNRQEYKDILDKLLKQFGERLTKVPITLPVMTALLPSVSSPLVLLITGTNIMTSELLRSLRSHLLPTGTVVVGLDSSKSEDEKAMLKKLLSPLLLENLAKYAGNDTKVIVCKGDAPPVTVETPEDLSKQLTP